jgi:Glycosyltransferase family 9 (heptosyltransferase)
MRWPAPLRALAEASVRQPLSAPVPDDGPAFAARKGIASLALRTLRRGLLLRASGQRPMLRTQFEPAWKRLLWIHEGMPQIGDALMDLAPRSLLVERGLQVDLFAAPHIASLFAGDPWFTRSLHRAGDVHAADYDAAIVLSHDRKALRLKQHRLAALPWVSLQGFYGGPDFHRALFATHRLADLLGITLPPSALARHAAQKLAVDPAAAAVAASTCPAADAITFALGGVWPERTYRHWPELLRRLRVQGHERFVLLGADNGRALADDLLAAADGAEVCDRVGRTSLAEAHALIARSAVAICADGGLMHLALASRTPTVALFNHAIDPAWRLPPEPNAVALRSATHEVDGIAPEHIAEAVATLLDAVPAGVR